MCGRWLVVGAAACGNETPGLGSPRVTTTFDVGRAALEHGLRLNLMEAEWARGVNAIDARAGTEIRAQK